MLIKVAISLFLFALVLISSFVECSDFELNSFNGDSFTNTGENDDGNLICGKNGIDNDVKAVFSISSIRPTQNEPENIEDRSLFKEILAFSESLYAKKFPSEDKRQILSLLFGSTFNKVVMEKETKAEIEELIFHPMIFSTLTHCADILSAREAVLIARAFPRFFSSHYDFVSNIKDFSAFQKFDIRQCVYSAKHFSLLSFPAAVHSLSISALAELFIELDSELGVDEFRALVRSRGGASEFINCPDFSQSPLLRPLMEMFEPAEFEAAASAKLENEMQIIKAAAPNNFHTYLGNLLSSDRIIPIFNDYSITDKQVKVSVLSYVLNVEHQLGLTFISLNGFYHEIAGSNHLKYNERVELFQTKSAPHHKLIEIIFAERRKLLKSLAENRPQLANMELFYIPFDPLIRESLNHLISASSDSIPLKFNCTDLLDIWIIIWKSLKFKYSDLPYNIDIIRDKYFQLNHDNDNDNDNIMIKEWEESTKDTLHFKSGQSAQLFLCIVMANVSPDLKLSVQKEFFSKNPRSYPLMLKSLIDVYFQIQDFSAFSGEELEKLSVPLKSFSFFSIPAALKTMTMDNLLKVLEDLDYDLDIYEFRYLVNIRGSTELINSPEFSHNPLLFPIMKMFTPDEFEAAALERTSSLDKDNNINLPALQFFYPRGDNLNSNSIETETETETKTKYETQSSTPWKHRYLGNLLNCDYLLPLSDLAYISKRNIKIALLSYVVSTEEHISRLFIDLKNLYLEAKKESENSNSGSGLELELELELYLKSARPHYDSLSFIFDERKKLFNALLGRPHKLSELELLKIPFDMLVREALIRSNDKNISSSIASFAANENDDLSVYSTIWKLFFFEYKDTLPYDNELIFKKFRDQKKYNIFKLWCEETKGNVSLQSGFIAQKFLSIATAHVEEMNDDIQLFFNAILECMKYYSPGNPSLGVVYQKYSKDGLLLSFDKTLSDFTVLENLSCEHLKNDISNSALKKNTVSRNTKHSKTTSRMPELVLANKIRSFPTEYFANLLLTYYPSPSKMAKSKFFKVIFTGGAGSSILPDQVVESLLKTPNGRIFLKEQKSLLHGLSNYAMFTVEDFIDLGVDLSALKLSYAFHTIPIQLQFKNSDNNIIFN